MGNLRYRLPSSRRLIASAAFQRVRQDGLSVRGKLLTLGVLRSETSEIRAGFVTSKRTGGAVTRNRTRRRLREIFRKHQHALAGGTWLVVIASPRAATASYAALEDDWLRLARRASILAP